MALKYWYGGRPVRAAYSNGALKYWYDGRPVHVLLGSTAYTASITISSSVGAATAPKADYRPTVTLASSVGISHLNLVAFHASTPIAITLSATPSPFGQFIASMNPGFAIGPAQTVSVGFPGDVTLGVQAGAIEAAQMNFVGPLPVSLTLATALLTRVAGVEAIEIDSTIGADIRFAGVAGSLTMSMALDQTPTVKLGAVGLVSLYAQCGTAVAGKLDASNSITPAMTLRMAPAGKLATSGAISAGVTLETASESGWAASFAFGGSFEITPDTTHDATGIIPLGLLMDAPVVAVIAGVNSLGFAVTLSPFPTTNVAFHSSASIHITLDTAAEVSSLYADSFELDLTAGAAAAGLLRLRSSIAAGVTVAASQSASLHLPASVTLRPRVGLTYLTKLEAVASAPMGITLHLASVGARAYFDNLILAADFNTATVFHLGANGPSIFAAPDVGTPSIFLPGGSDGTPSIFGSGEDDETPGIFDPR